MSVKIERKVVLVDDGDGTELVLERARSTDDDTREVYFVERSDRRLDLSLDDVEAWAEALAEFAAVERARVAAEADQ